MFPLQEAPVRRFPRGKVFIGLLIILLTVGTTLASRITLNSGGNITFGQGVLNIKSCDGWIKIEFSKTSSSNGVERNGSMVMAVNEVLVKSFDPIACKNTNFKIKLFKTGSLTPLALYTQEDGTPASQVWLSVNNDGLVTLLDTAGRDLGDLGDSAVGFGRDPETGDFIANFFTPLAAASDVDSTTVESGPNRA